jgi:hypothetical protein
MAFDAASFLDSIRAAKTWVARYVGISGLGTNPTNPWCQHPSRSPLHCESELAPPDGNGLTTRPETTTANSEIAVWQRCFICGLALTADGGGEQEI